VKESEEDYLERIGRTLDRTTISEEWRTKLDLCLGNVQPPGLSNADSVRLILIAEAVKKFLASIR
jgi:hypothetical protein